MALPIAADMAVFFNTDDFASVADIGTALQVPCIFTDERVMMQDGSGMVNETLKKVLLVPYTYAPSAAFGTAITNVTYRGNVAVSGDEYLIQRVYRDRLTDLLKLTLEKTADGSSPAAPAVPVVPADSLPAPAGATVTTLTFDTPVSGSGLTNDLIYYKVYAHAGTQFTATLTQLSADIDLYVSRDYYPLLGQMGDYNSRNGGANDELVTFANTVDGWVRVTVFCYGGGDYTLTVSEA